MIIGNRDVTNPLEVIECIVAFDCKDYSVRPRDRMLYVIVFGWDDESFTKFGWDKETIDEYKELHKRFKELSKIEFGKGVAEALQQPQVGGWTPVTERLPNMEEYIENDGRFILDDGNRRYQGLFDIYDKKFKCSKHLSGLGYELIEDNCVIAWQPLPEPYKESEGE